MTKNTTCGVCGGQVAAGSMCPWAVACPHCHAEPRAWCSRPSGHKAQDLHKARFEAAEAIDKERGITYE